MIEEAAAFAAQAHHGTFRKGTQIPYITHPMEAALIVSGFTDDPEMIAAALLHDVVEDTGVTEEEIRERFGSRVACLVANETEDKTKCWRERKGATIQHLKSAPREIKILALGDKLSNMRCTAKDYLVLGDEIWQRFNEKDKAMHVSVLSVLVRLVSRLYVQVRNCYRRVALQSFRSTFLKYSVLPVRLRIRMRSC